MARDPPAITEQSLSMAPFWEQAWKDAQPVLSFIWASLPSFPALSPRILHVGQLDAELLNQELLGVLKEPVKKAIGRIKVCSYSISTRSYERVFLTYLTVCICNSL
jgi:hypothetical protein